MKVIESTSAGSKGGKAGLLDRFTSSSGGKEAQAQDALIAALQKVLDNKFILLRNIHLEGPDVMIPVILVGPPGIRIIYCSPSKGVYRAKEDSWEEMDERTNRFRVARPNLLARTALMARGVEAYLSAHGHPVMEVEPVLYFSDPGVHVDTSRPVVRIVLSDALDRFCAGLLQSRPFLEPEAVQRVVQILRQETPQEPEPLPGREIHDQFSFIDLPEEKPARPEAIVLLDRSEPRSLKRVPFSSRQLMILGGLLVFNILLITAFILVVLLLP